MVFSKKIKLFVYFIFLISFFSNIFAASYPGFSFAGGNYPSGLVNISGLASSGTIVELSINSNFISSQNVLSGVKIANLSFGILDTSIPVGATLRFSNNLQSTIFVLNISGFGFNTLNPNDIYDFSSYNIGDFSYRDENTLVRKTISVIDKMENFNFENIPQNYLNDGSNSAGFVIKSLKDNSVLKTQNISFNYDKYPVKISLNNFTNVTNQKKIVIHGVTTDSTSPLNYILNFDGVISNLGMLNPITVRADGSFNLSVNNLNEGMNSIRFISLDKNNNEIFNGEKKFNILVDTQIPSINILSAFYTAANVLGNNGNTKRNADFSLSEMFINGNNLILNISTDAIVINYTLNSRNMSCGTVINSTVSCNLNLVNGQNNLTLYAIDVAGNIFKEAHTIMLDTSSLSLKTNTLEPKQGSTVHFFLQDLKGNVNKGGVKITAFTIGQDSKYFYTDASGTQQTNSASCNDFKFMGLTRDVGYVDYSVVGGQINPTDKQISLLDLVSKKVSGVSDGNGYFVLKNLVLKDKSFDPNAQNTNSVSKVSSVNTICFIMADKFGNVNTASSSLTLDAGNTQWSPGEISLTPNTVYAAEIEQLQNSRSNGGNIRFGLIGHLHYSGSGNLKDVSAPLFRTDSSLNKDSQFIRVIQNEMHFKIDKRTNDMIFYFPVEVLPMNKKPLDYPKSLNLGFAVSMTYSVVGKDIPIDTVNPVYFQTQLNIETPLDTAKWLSPAMLDKGINFLNKSIKFTKTAKKYLGVGAIGGVVACTAAKFYYGAQIALEKSKGGADSQKNINNYKRDLYYICDRVVCSAAPAKCDASQDSNFFSFLKKGDKVDLNPSEKDLSDKRSKTEITGVGKDKHQTLSQFNSLDCSNFNTCISGGKAGISCRSSQTQYTQKNYMGSSYKQTDKIIVPNSCGEAKFDNINWTGKSSANQNDLQNYLKSHNNQFPPGFKATPTDVNLKGMSSSCYSEGADRFDETRAFGQSGVNPKDGLIDSIQSVCITDTYSHVSKYLLIQEEIKKCLQGAKIGIAKGAYCERLMSQAVCDVATYAIFKTASEKAKRTTPETHTENGFLAIVNGASTGDALLNDRYSNSKFFSAAGLGSNNVVKNVCLAAITGDWSILTNSILGAIDKNQVEPSFGPPIPISRMQSYDPLTGDLAIMYKFTYAAISGGQNINTKVEFLCDPNGDNGDYCPENTILSSADPNSGSSLTNTNLYVNKGDFKQENIVLFDKTARYRYNVLKLTHSFDLNGKKTNLEQRVPISPRGEGMLFNCHWNSVVSGSNLNSGSNYGIYCDPLFGKDSSISAYRFGKNSHLSPEKSNVYYPGNNVYLNFNYDVRSNLPNQQNSFDLAYRADCNGGKGRTIIVGSKSIDTKGSNLGNNITDLFSIPGHLALNSNSKSNLFQLDLNIIQKGMLGNYASTSGKFVGIEAVNTNGLVGQSFNIQGFTGLSNSFQLNQNLVVNGQSKNEKLQKIIDYSGESHLEFKTDRIVTGTNFYLIYGTKNKEGKITNVEDRISFSAPGTLSSKQHVSFENLHEGSCKLDVKILPPGKGDLVTYDTFDNISAIGNSKDVISNINSNNNLNTLHLNFVVKDTPVGENLKLNPNFFELTKPISNGYICVAPGSNLDLTYIFQGPNGVLKDKNLKLTGNLIAVRDTSKFTNTLKQIKSNGPGTFSFVVPGNFEKNKTFEMKLNYVLKYDTKKGIKNLLDKNIGFNLRVSDKCSLGSVNGKDKQNKKPTP